MNRIVLGIDRAGRYEAAVRLLARLRFADAEVTPLHAVETPTVFLGDVALPATIEIMEDLIAEETEAGQRLAAEVAATLKGDGYAAGDAAVLPGGPAPLLMDRADRIGARLIAVGSEGKGAVRAFLTGGVGRALVMGAHQSVLVAKGDPAPVGPVRAVFATDHSPYADRCLEELLALAPRGLSHLTVLTCYPKDLVEAVRPFAPEFVLDPAEWIEESLRERNEQAVGALAPLAAHGCGIGARVFPDTPAYGIARVMQETAADLLILGAQGHGFFERLSLGSTSFHQVMAEPYPVLVLRAPMTAP
jgi:nucleotide-binding universal stress UspA family protein